MLRSAIFSRDSGLQPANCQATAAAEDPSITESSPNPMSAVDATRAPSVRAMAGSNGGEIASVVRSVFCSSMFSLVMRRISYCSFALMVTACAAGLASAGL
ncbi:hypothetical protein LQ424_30680 [Rhodococcus qingshengii]|uniref:hypothetical protein n=1 Tax=Rhodococcus qingshengii TaxID=334542 RepID=UPI001C4DE1D1|nr:hypothetical protein [Rhodococcus qingshengii]MCD2136194.1 hypothetical protein [Rhodococcus qingshengii]UGQ55190.1 hypothetical protein LRL17_30255 [Rhodococcus qingshengii]